MTRLSWDAIGQRFYETGVDRGVLFLDGQPAVSWNGLISVQESSSGGEPTPYYMDGFKYLNIASSEEFEATINAYSAPAEFGPCDGTVSIQNGLFITQQRRVSFGFSYRTMVGNDIDGTNLGYKIHLVYNALAAPTQRSNATTGDKTEAETFGWSITTRPPTIAGHKPTSHLVIESRLSTPTTLSGVEDLLYGTDSMAGRLPTPAELIALFTV